MKLAKNAFIIALTMLTLVFTMSAQTLRSADDPRNTAPTVGTGGPPGGPTGLFTIYDGQTLRAGEFTFSAAWSNYDRDPGNVDISEIPVSFQAGVNDYLELFFNTDAYRAIKVNSPRNLSSFYLPNSQLRIGNVVRTPPAIVLGSGAFAGQPVFRNNQAFIQFPFVGGRTTVPTATSVIGFPIASSGNGADNFPGVGSIYGSILPGVVLQTTTVGTGAAQNVVPTAFTTAPSYLPDAPFINRTYGESAFNTFTVGAKIRFTGTNNPVGIGLIPFYRFYADGAGGRGGGFNQLQRGASPGGGGPNPFGDNGRGDFGLVLFGDARLAKWVNVSANLGYIYNSSVKADFGGSVGDVTLLDRPDEVLAGIGVDFPVNRYFQPILEFRSTQYVGGRTPNAFENSPLDGLAGARFYPTRYISLGAAYRYHFNQQDNDSFGDDTFRTTATVPGAGGGAFTSSFSGVPPGFLTSSDPHGFIFQVTAGRRNARKQEVINQFADVTTLVLSETTVTTPCPPGQRPRAGQTCSDDMSVNVTTTAVDPENDVLTYNYTVSGGRIVGQGANVQWDLTGAQPGSYTITAGVDDACGVCGKTQTATITVATCECEVECTCPTLDVTGPTGATTPGEVMTFTATVTGGSQATVTYDWSVTSGTIIEGQGTPSIRVQTTPEMAGTNVTATVTIGGLCETCPQTSDSETGIVAALPTFSLIDTLEVLPADEVRARLDAFFTQLQNDPTATAVIITDGSNRDVTRRETLIRNHINFRNQDPNRFTFVRGTGTELRTRLFVVPAGATPPTPDTP